ncbi:lytic transglycosylase domain-containing protein [Lysobacter humi (ex Lee et al. 2017)]
MKTITVLLALAGLASAGSAAAGTVYRCDGANGRSYSSKRIPGAACQVVSRYTARGGKASAPSTVVAAPASAGSVTASASVAGSPASGSVAPVSFGSTPAAASAAAPAKPVPVSSGTAGAPRLVQGQVYSYMKDGVRHYSSRRPAGVAHAGAVRTIRFSYMESCFACAAKPGVNFGTIRLKDAYRQEIAAAASRHGVDEAIVRAIIHAESAYNPNALSRVGAQGLMQLMPATARRFGVRNAFDPVQNIDGGVQYLAWLLKRFNGNLTLAAAGYNAGEGAVDKYRGVPPYNETQRYVQRVALLADRYRAQTVSR